MQYSVFGPLFKRLIGMHQHCILVGWPHAGLIITRLGWHVLQRYPRNLHGHAQTSISTGHIQEMQDVHALP